MLELKHYVISAVVVGFFALLISSFANYDYTVSIPKSMNNPTGMSVLSVVDGDTLTITAPFLPDPLKKTLLLRIRGIDTPEKGYRAKCAKEKHLGESATAYLKDLAVAKDFTRRAKVELEKWDKYGGRVLGDIVIDNERLSAIMIKQGYARQYDGRKKSDWCGDTQ